MKTILLAASVMLLTATAASATTYNGVRDINGSTANLSVTTDGTIGELTSANILGFNVIVTDGAGAASLDNFNSALDITGTNLSATSSGIYFNFDNESSSIFLIELGSIGDDGPFYCASASSGCFGESSASEGLSSQNGETPISSAARSGTIELASTSVGAVPEPVTWAMMIGGFGLIGGMMRRAHRKSEEAFTRKVRLLAAA